MDPSISSQEKQAIRQRMLALRDGLAPHHVLLASQKAAQWGLMALGSLLGGGFCNQASNKRFPSPIIGLYWPIKGEIDCFELLASLRKVGVSLALPVCLDKDEAYMDFRFWRSDAELVSAGFGTRAPSDLAGIVYPDVVIAPLVGFDGWRNRLGYGAGYYDRYIARASERKARPLVIGYGFAIQQVDKLPQGRYDQPLDLVITDKGLI